MTIKETYLKGCYEITDTVFEDDRGYFFESFHQQKFYDATGINVNFIQDNQSKSTYGVLRGIHFQKGEFSQAKLVRVLEGSVLDVVVDLRKNSKTFGKTFSTELTDKNKKQVFIPRGFGHGFVVLSTTAVFFYKCDNAYNKSSESGIVYNDPELSINWQLSANDIILSEKDSKLPTLTQIKNELDF